MSGGEIKKGRASLVGGIAVGVGVFCLAWLIARDAGATGMLAALPGAALSAAVGTWIRVADL